MCKVSVGICNVDVSCVMSNVDRDSERDGRREVKDMGRVKVSYGSNYVYIIKWT